MAEKGQVSTLIISNLASILCHPVSATAQVAGEQKGTNSMTYQGAGQPAGWYYAEGDPPGTHRYWDGVMWQGGPQPVAGAALQGGSGQVGRFADYGPRFIGALIDWGIGIAINIVGQGLLGAVGSGSKGLASIIGLLFTLLGIGWWLYNYVYLQGSTGQTIGKKQQGTKLVSSKTGEPVGIGMALVRGIVGGILTAICLLDLIWIFIDDENRRLTDKIFDFQVIQTAA